MDRFFETMIKQLRKEEIMEYLVKWKNLLVKNAVWEEELFIRKHPQLIKHWGQRLFEGEGHLKS